MLSALLTGRALEVYSRLSGRDVVNYDRLKEALLSRYDLTEEGYRSKFKTAKPLRGESCEQFIVRLQNYVQKWTEMAKCDESWPNVRSLLVKEQFVNSCPSNVAIHQKEQAPKDLAALAALVNQFLSAHGMSLTSSREKNSADPVEEWRECNSRNHKAKDCPKKKTESGFLRCFLCDRVGHLAKDCRARVPARNCNKASVSTIDATNVTSKIIYSFSGWMQQPVTNRFPIAAGCVSDKVVSVLRDTGCNGVIVKRQFVQDKQFGDVVNMTLLDMSTVQVPLAKIVVDCPYYKGEVIALCVTNSLHDLIIGNVNGAKMPIDGEIQAAAVTRAQANTKAKEPKSLEVNDGSKWLAVNSLEFKTAQEADGSLNHIREMNARKVKGEGTAYFKVENGLLYWFYQHPNVSCGKEVRQLVVPSSLRDKTMEIAHDSFEGGHMGNKKTFDNSKQFLLARP